jgi:hypothetical protein
MKIGDLVVVTGVPSALPDGMPKTHCQSFANAVLPQKACRAQSHQNEKNRRITQFYTRLGVPGTGRNRPLAKPKPAILGEANAPRN